MGDLLLRILMVIPFSLYLSFHLFVVRFGRNSTWYGQKADTVRSATGGFSAIRVPDFGLTADAWRKWLACSNVVIKRVFDRGGDVRSNV